MNVVKKFFLCLIKDPGFGFSLVSFLFFFDKNVVGMISTLIAIIFIGICVIFSKCDIGNNFSEWLKKPATSLNIAALSLYIVAVSILLDSLVLSAYAETSAAAHQNLSPLLSISSAAFIAAFSFATADVLLGRYLSNQITQTHHQNLLLSPDTYLFMGYCAVACMTGVYALLIMPLAITSFALTLRNNKQNLDPTTGRPVLFYAATSFGFALLCLPIDNTVHFTANFLAGLYLLRVDWLQQSLKNKNLSPQLL